MFSLSIMVGAGQWRLLFRTEEKANDALQFIIEPTQEVRQLTDDFGQKFIALPKAIHAVMLEDMRQSKLASVELALHEARTRAAAMKASQSDRELMEATRAQGPSVITPNMNGVSRFS